MKVSEIHSVIQTQVDDLQRKAKNSARDQACYIMELQERQRQMKALMAITIKEGDRDLTGTEIMDLALTKDDNDKLYLTTQRAAGPDINLENYADLEKKFS